MTNKVTVTFLLDETGSMESIADDTIGGFNHYLGRLQALDAEVTFTLLKFDSDRVEKVCVGQPVADVARLTRETYRPGAMTPLYDAACQAIRLTDEPARHADKAIVVIQTDGQENASREHKRTDLAKLIEARTAAGWEFVFLGAGIDAFDEATALGIGRGTTMSYARAASAETFAAMADNMAGYIEGSALTLDFSDAQRLATGDATAR